MKVLLILTVLFLFSCCSETQELTGPWEMWVLVSSPSAGDVWGNNGEARIIRWAAVPGETVRCDLFRNDQRVMEIFDWRNGDQGVFTVLEDLTEAGRGSGYKIVITDDQGFYGKSDEFTII